MRLASLRLPNKFGTLGGSINTGVQIHGESFLRLQGESFSDWVRAMTELRTMLAIWEGAKNSSADDLGKYFHWSDGAVFYDLPNGGELIWLQHIPQNCWRASRLET